MKYRSLNEGVKQTLSIEMNKNKIDELFPSEDFIRQDIKQNIISAFRVYHAVKQQPNLKQLNSNQLASKDSQSNKSIDLKTKVSHISPNNYKDKSTVQNNEAKLYKERIAVLQNRLKEKTNQLKLKEEQLCKLTQINRELEQWKLDRLIGNENTGTLINMNGNQHRCNIQTEQTSHPSSHSTKQLKPFSLNQCLSLTVKPLQTLARQPFLLSQQQQLLQLQSALSKYEKKYLLIEQELKQSISQHENQFATVNNKLKAQRQQKQAILKDFYKIQEENLQLRQRLEELMQQINELQLQYQEIQNQNKQVITMDSDYQRFSFGLNQPNPKSLSLNSNVINIHFNHKKIIKLNVKLYEVQIKPQVQVTKESLRKKQMRMNRTLSIKINYKLNKSNEQVQGKDKISKNTNDDLSKDNTKRLQTLSMVKSQLPNGIIHKQKQQPIQIQTRSGYLARPQQIYRSKQLLSPSAVRQSLPSMDRSYDSRKFRYSIEENSVGAEQRYQSYKDNKNRDRQREQISKIKNQISQAYNQSRTFSPIENYRKGYSPCQKSIDPRYRQQKSIQRCDDIVQKINNCLKNSNTINQFQVDPIKGKKSEKNKQISKKNYTDWVKDDTDNNNRQHQNGSGLYHNHSMIKAPVSHGMDPALLDRTQFNSTLHYHSHQIKSGFNRTPSLPSLANNKNSGSVSFTQPLNFKLNPVQSKHLSLNKKQLNLPKNPIKIGKQIETPSRKASVTNDNNNLKLIGSISMKQLIAQKCKTLTIN